MENKINLNMENKIKDLKESPLYNLSLVNKELFHSNFIAWFGKTYPAHFIELIEKLLDNEKKWLDGDKFDIRREFNHFDISVFEGENLKLVIENKVKSVPTQNQLDEYKNKIKNENVQLILLTMNEQLHESTSEQDNENIGWKIVNYRTLSEGLKSITDIDNDYHKGLLADYCTYISNLESVIEYYTNNDKYFDKEKYTTLKDLGIHDVCGKREMQDVYNKLVKRLNDKGIATNNSDVLVKWDYTNAKPLIEVKFKHQEDNVFIQIQGNQYRHAVEFFDKEIGERIVKIEKSYYPNNKGIEYLKKTYSYFFGENAIENYPNLENDTKEFGMREKQGYCKYCNGKTLANGHISCWVYQWIKIPEKIAKEDLISAICEDTKKIRKELAK